MKTMDFELVNNTHDVDEAHDLINQMLKSKINFLELKRLSLNVRCGEVPPEVTNRLEELKDAREQLSHFLRNLTDDYELEIYCPIRIHIKEKGQSSNTLAEIVNEH